MQNNKTRRIVEIAMLTALATALMYFEFPIFFIPQFYKIDLSDIPAIIGGFAIDPIAGVIIELLKVILHGLTKGTESAWVGEIANFAIGAMYIIPAGYIYKHYKTKKSAIIGMSIGTASMTVIGAVINAVVLLPLYAKLFLGSMDNIIKVSSAVNPHINSVWTLVLLGVVPFNIIKGVIISIITYFLYKRVRKVIK